MLILCPQNIAYVWGWGMDLLLFFSASFLMFPYLRDSAFLTGSLLTIKTQFTHIVVTEQTFRKRLTVVLKCIIVLVLNLYHNGTAMLYIVCLVSACTCLLSPLNCESS